MSFIIKIKHNFIDFKIHILTGHKKLFYKNKIKFLWLVYSGSVTVRFIYHREMLNRRLRDVLVICLCVGGLVCGQHSERGPDGDWTQPV